jgi:hypothetical protein
MMLTKTGWLALATAALCIGLGRGRVEAGGIVISTPTGLSPGDTFRIAFVTDAGNAGTSSSISTYNSFVNADATSEAGGGLVTYNGVAITWFAIASTASTDAITNVGVSGAPVYLASGTLVTNSDSSSGLWSGSLDNPIDQDLKGSVFGGEDAWTGTLASGTGDPGHQLGTSSVELGSAGAVSSSWVAAFPFPTGLEDLSLYGISQVLTVGSASVPEPSSLVMAGTAISAGCAFGWSRRRRNQRRQRFIPSRRIPPVFEYGQTPREARC